MKYKLSTFMFTVCLVFSVLAHAEKQADKTIPANADALFVMDKVWTVHLIVTAEDHKKMMPEMPQRGFGPFIQIGPPGPPPGQDVIVPLPSPTGPPPGGIETIPRIGRLPNQPSGPGPLGPPMFERDYPEVRATFEFEGKTIGEIGLRYKGNSSFRSSQFNDKKSYKLDFNQYDKKLRFFGLTKLNLNNNFSDPSMMREALAYEVFRDAGVPAGRTSYARVYLTVKGEAQKQYLGLYTLIEQVDERMLGRFFKQKDGLLLKPQMVQGLPNLGNDWKQYEKRYGVRAEGKEAEAKRFIALTKLVNDADDKTFAKEIGSFLDVKAFARFIVLNSLVANLDSILSMGQNYYIYHEPEQDRFHFLPWDLNMAFGGFPMAGTSWQQMELSLLHPHAGEHKLIDRVLALEGVKKMWLEEAQQILDTAFRADKLNARIDALSKALRPAIADESADVLSLFDKALSATLPDMQAPPTRGEGGVFNRGFGGPGGMGRAQLPLKPFIAKRIASAREQVAEKSFGFVPQRRMGPGPRAN
jgi:spore coat protein H